MIFLIGLRGSGKTTVGRALADRLALPFRDADAELETRAGRTIRDIFSTDGEAAFRELEEQTLVELIARGPANRARLKAAGTVVWLTADADVLWRRTQADPTTAERRPNLVSGGRAEIDDLMRLREPLYRSVADFTVDTSGRSPEQIAADILAAC